MRASVVVSCVLVSCVSVMCVSVWWCHACFFCKRYFNPYILPSKVMRTKQEVACQEMGVATKVGSV